MTIDFTLDKPNPDSARITNALWWFWLEFRKVEPTVQLGGIYANKSGFHNTGQANLDRWPGNYSVRDAINRSGPWWRSKASAIDLTFPDAHSGDYKTIAKYSKRLYNSGRDLSDPRLDMIMFEFFGQIDNDRTVEGWREYYEESGSSDPSHLWHIHISLRRDKCGDFWGMWALLTVLMGWTVAQWRESLKETSVTIREQDTWVAYRRIEAIAGMKGNYPDDELLPASMRGARVPFFEHEDNQNKKMDEIQRTIDEDVNPVIDALNEKVDELHQRTFTRDELKAIVLEAINENR